MKRRGAVAAAAAVVLVWSGSGCRPGPDEQDTLWFVNETDQRISVVDEDTGFEQVVGADSYTSIGMSGCHDATYTARTDDGSILATLDGQLCARQSWTIYGPNDAELAEGDDWRND